MTIEEFAKMLDGRGIDNEITHEEREQAKSLGFVVIFGYSDDGAYLCGAIEDSVGCYNGGEMHLDEHGLFEECDCECSHSVLAKEKYKLIDISWDDSEEGFAWTYDTEIPHATFEIMDEEDNKWCRGIVFDIKSLGDEPNV